MKEFKALKELYHELIDRYLDLNVRDDYFEDEFLHESCWLQRCIRNKERERMKFLLCGMI